MSESNSRIMVASADDAALICFAGEIPDVAAQLKKHGANAIRLEPPVQDLAFLRPAAPLLKQLFIMADAPDITTIGDLPGLEVLHLRRPTTLRPLGPLSRLTRLSIGGRAPWEELSACRSLRELIVYGNPEVDVEPPLPDLAPLRALTHLEYLRLVSVHLQSLDGIEALTSLRSLVMEQTFTKTAASADYVSGRFGFDVAKLVPRRPGDERRLRRARWFLHADQVVAERVLHDVPVERRYEISLTRERPGCVLLLVDRSGSMSGPCGEDWRAKRKAEAEGLTDSQRKELERALGSDLTRSEVVARAVNRFLPAFATRCGDHARVDIGVIEYGDRVGHAWGGALAGRALVPVDEVIAHPVRMGVDGPVWLEPEARGSTPLRDALHLATEIVGAWCRAHPDSFPPVVINIFGEDPNPGDIYRDAWALRSQGTSFGPALLFWIAKRWAHSSGMFAAEELITGNEHHFRLASPMPPTVEDAARRAGYPFPGTVRGAFGDASPDDFENLLHILTAMPGIPWTTALLRHGLPPFAPTREDIKQWTMKRTAGGVASDFTAPTLKRPMTLDLFWKIIERTRKGVTDPDEHGDRILETLAQFDEGDLIEFDRLLSERLAESHRHDLWAVAFIAQGGCSDDAFDYFQCWLVSQGRRYFETALADPQKAARRIEPGDEAQFERLGYLAAEAYEAKSGKRDFETRRQPVPRTLKGRAWEEEDLPRMYPRLFRRYG